MNRKWDPYRGWDSCYWVAASPHEWKWNPQEQAAMARVCVDATNKLGDVLRILETFQTSKIVALNKDHCRELANWIGETRLELARFHERLNGRDPQVSKEAANEAKTPEH